MNTLPASFPPASPVMKEIYRKVGILGRNMKPCYFVGSSGTGKEFLAYHHYLAWRKSAKYDALKRRAEGRRDYIRGECNKNNIGKAKRHELSKFYNNIKIGFMHSENCAAFSEDVARSELFGHVKGAFTGADENKPGLLELLTGSVLFLDEVGYLQEQVQAMLHRSLDPPYQGSRIGSAEKYPTDLVHIIAATEKRTEPMISDAFRPRLGSRIEIPDLKDRDDDLKSATRFFLKQELIMLSEDEAIKRVLGYRRNGSIVDHLVDEFVEELALKLDRKVLERSWKDNFRSLKTTLEIAVVMSEDFSSKKNYINNILAEFDVEKLTCSDQKNVIVQTVNRGKQYSSYPSENPELDEKYTEAIARANANIPHRDKKNIASFLAASNNNGFQREDMDRFLKDFGDTNNNSKSTTLNRLQELRRVGILYMTGSGKSARYHVHKSHAFSTNGAVRRSFLSLPPDDMDHADRADEIRETVKLAKKSDCLFIYGEPGGGKTSFATTLGHRLRKDEKVYWYQMGRRGMHRFLRTLAEDLRFHHYVPDIDYNAYSNTELYQLVNQHRNKLFELDREPYLIVDNAQVLKEYENKKWLMKMLSEWRDMRFILIGNQLDSDIEPSTGRHFHQKGLAIIRKTKS